jgi:GNAT superfamily N-acetyltransferase
VKIGPDFQRASALVDGTPVVLRMVRPGDADELRRQFQRLSPSSRYRRFLSAAMELSEDMVEYLTEVDGVDHVAIVAVTDSHDLKSEVGLGIGRFVRLADEPEVAEPAVTVVDDAQHKGVGRLLLSTLAEAARERGIRVFRAEVLADNAPMRHLLAELGATLREGEGGVLVCDIDLGARARPSTTDGTDEPGDGAGPDSQDNALWHLFRLIAQSLLAIRFGRRR